MSTYVPQNPTEFSVAVAAVIAGMAEGSGVPIAPPNTEATYTPPADIAIAFGMSFDVLWGEQIGELVPNTFQVFAIESCIANVFGHYNVSLANATTTNPNTYTTIAQAIIDIIKAGGDALTAIGVTPPPFGGEGAVGTALTRLRFVDNGTAVPVGSQNGSAITPYSSINTGAGSWVTGLPAPVSAADASALRVAILSPGILGADPGYNENVVLPGNRSLEIRGGFDDQVEGSGGVFVNGTLQITLTDGDAEDFSYTLRDLYWNGAITVNQSDGGFSGEVILSFIGKSKPNTAVVHGFLSLDTHNTTGVTTVYLEGQDGGTIDTANTTNVTVVDSLFVGNIGSADPPNGLVASNVGEVGTVDLNTAGSGIQATDTTFNGAIGGASPPGGNCSFDRCKINSTLDVTNGFVLTAQRSTFLGTIGGAHAPTTINAFYSTIGCPAVHSVGQQTYVECIFGNTAITSTTSELLFFGCTFPQGSNPTVNANTVSIFDGDSWSSFLQAGGVATGKVLVQGGYAKGIVQGAPLTAAALAAGLVVSLNGTGASAGFGNGGNYYVGAVNLTANSSIQIAAGGGEFEGDVVRIEFINTSSQFSLSVLNDVGGTVALVPPLASLWIELIFGIPTAGGAHWEAAGQAFTINPLLVAVPVGTIQSLVRSPEQTVINDSTGAQSTDQFPAAPLNGDIVIVKLVGAAVANPVLLTARGGASIENPGNPGNFSAANGTVAMTNQGQTAWFQYQQANTRWVQIV